MIIKIKIDTKIYLNYYSRSQSQPKLKAKVSLSQLPNQPIKLQKPFQVLSRNSFRRMSADTATANTIGMAFKEYMKNIPDDINTSKDLDEHLAQFKKDFKEKKKNAKIEIAEKKKEIKKNKKSNLDENGNEKPKKALTKYQQYIRDNQQRIREEFPDLSNTERLTQLAKEWKAYKATLLEAVDGDEETVEPIEEPVNVPVVKDVEEAAVEDDAKPKKPKKAKTDKKNVKDSE